MITHNTKQETKLSRDEWETHINIDDQDRAEVYTTIPKDIRKFTRLNWEIIDTQTYANGDVMSVTFRVPRKAIAFRRYDPNRPKKAVNLKGVEALKQYREKINEITNQNRES